MGCFSLPKNKNKVASHQAEQSGHHGSKNDHLLSRNQPVVLPDPDNLSGEQSPGTGALSTATGLRLKPGKERAPSVLSTGYSIGRYSSSRLIQQNPRVFSAPVNYPLAGVEGSGGAGAINATPFSAPLPSSRTPPDSTSPVGFSAPMAPAMPFSPPTASYGSPLCCAGVGVLDSKRAAADKKANDNKTGVSNEKKKAFSGRPLRLPEPQTTPCSNGHPLPLPHSIELDDTATSAAFGNQASQNSFAPSPSRPKEGGFLVQNFASRSGVEPMPLPPPALPTESRTLVRAFSYSELANSLTPEFLLSEGVFGTAYRTSVGDDDNRRIEVAVVCPIAKALQGLREWMAEVNWLARLQNPHLCKLIGYCSEDLPGLGTRRLLVYEFMSNGSLDRYVKGKETNLRLDWSTRMRVALDIAQGLAYLHDKAPFQVICRDLSSPGIQLDKDLRAKLSGFGLARCGPEGDQGPPMAGPYAAPESRSNGLVTIKSNAWSFGILLLELLTGRRHMDPTFPCGEQNLVQLTKPFLRDEGKLFLILDPELNCKYSGRGVWKVASLAFQCLMKEASLRPNLSEVVDVLKAVQIDDETLATDLKKSRSLSQSMGSPLNYSRSTSDNFIQRGPGLNSFTNSVTSSPSNDQKQRDREFLKLAMLGSATSSPSYIESRLSVDPKQPKSLFSDRDAQKLPIPVQPLESRQHTDGTQHRERDSQRVVSGPLTETTASSTPSSDSKLRGLQKVGSYGKMSSVSSLNDLKQSSGSPGHLQGREVKKLHTGGPAGHVVQGDHKLQNREMQRLPSRTHAHEPLQATDQQQSREAQKLPTPQTTGSLQHDEIKHRSSEAWKLRIPRAYSSLPSSGEIKKQVPEAWKTSRSSSRSGEIRQQSTEARKVLSPESADVIEKLSAIQHGSKLPVPAESLESNSPVSETKQEEQDGPRSNSSRSSASSRSSCAPTLTFDPPMLREAF